ncbi:MAG TPA: hypothetical protein VH951_00275 [Dehalococcoidia bacterium]
MPPRKETAIATIGFSSIQEQVAALVEREPHPDTATPDEVVAFVLSVRDAIDSIGGDLTSLADDQQRYLREAAALQVHNAQDRLERDRHVAIDILERLFRLGSVPAPNGRYDGEVVGFSTGLLSDPFFEWLTRIYLPWLGKTFDAASQSGDNVFVDNAWSKASGRLGWPEYRVRCDDDPPGTIRVFPFESYIAAGIEDPDVRVLKIDYGDSRNPLPVRRVIDELVELPGGYCLGKVHMRGLRHMRRVAFFGLVPAGFGAIVRDESRAPVAP